MKDVAVLLFDDIEALDFAGPFEVFSVCGASGRVPGNCNVFTVAERSPVVARNGLSINPDYLLSTSPAPDILVVPGGGGYTAAGTPYGSRKEMDNPAVLDWVKRCGQSAERVLSVCTGSLILAKTGLLEGLSATTHWKAMDQLEAVAPNTVLVRGKRWVDNGSVITSAGVSAGIDMSLHVIATLWGAEVASATAVAMEYDHWNGTSTLSAPEAKCR